MIIVITSISTNPNKLSITTQLMLQTNRPFYMQETTSLTVGLLIFLVIQIM